MLRPSTTAKRFLRPCSSSFTLFPPPSPPFKYLLPTLSPCFSLPLVTFTNHVPPPLPPSTPPPPLPERSEVDVFAVDLHPCLPLVRFLVRRYAPVCALSLFPGKVVRAALRAGQGFVDDVRAGKNDVVLVRHLLQARSRHGRNKQRRVPPSFSATPTATSPPPPTTALSAFLT